MFGLDKQIRRTVELRNELAAAKLGRRELAKLGLIAGSAHWAKGASLRRALAQTVPAIALTPWKDPLPIPPRLRPHAYEYETADHQYCGPYRGRDYAADADHCYRLEAKEHGHRFHSELGESKVWSYCDEVRSFGGPVLDVRYGQPFCIDMRNGLDDEHTGYGQPEIAPHLHNFHTATESDGGPWNWLKKGEERVLHYNMARAGFTDPLGSTNAYYTDKTGAAPGGTWWASDEGGGDLRETLTTLFMHDHRPEYTAANVYKGMFMMIRAFDSQDTGNEATGWKLPSDDYDVPLMFQDKQITPDGEMTFDQFAVDGFLGPYLTVNGAIKPYMNVEPRAYRFRLLNGGPSRFYRFVFRTSRRNLPFGQITESGNFLQKPRTGLQNIDLWVAERSDIIVDFTGLPVGTEVIMSNTLQMRSDGRGEDVGKTLNPDDPANQVLKFKVVPATRSHPTFKMPDAFRPLPPLPADLSKLKRRTFKLERKGGMWAINGQFWDPDADHDAAVAGRPAQHVIERDSAEIWTLDSSSGGWDHPMHIHFEEGQVIARNGASIPEASRTRVDVYRMRQSKIDIMLRFRDYPQVGWQPKSGRPGQIADDHGRYVMHCHNVVHEDHAMMVTFTVKPKAGAV